MAQFSVRRLSELDDGLVLAPERYDPRRRLRSTADGHVLLSELVSEVRETVHSGTPGLGAVVVADTTHARDGVLAVSRDATPAQSLGSSKKRIRPGDVIISRLRPYLRQVAYIDQGARATVVSSEFLVLRPLDGAPIAFLAPFLLSSPVQTALAAAQEGGHHPRFSAATLLALPVPRALVERREELSEVVERAMQQRREADRGMLSAVEQAAAAISDVDR